MSQFKVAALLCVLAVAVTAAIAAIANVSSSRRNQTYEMHEVESETWRPQDGVDEWRKSLGLKPINSRCWRWGAAYYCDVRVNDRIYTLLCSESGGCHKRLEG
jgi:hypothetical protein